MNNMVSDEEVRQALAEALDLDLVDAASLTPDDVAEAISRLRAKIDEIDNEIIAIVKRRIALSKQIQAIRMAHTGRRLEHSRELQIVNAYVEGLGRGGGQLALAVLELSRGRA
ncbi:MAG: chorismate mutase [Acidothermus sp.]|nr:chorismate mutase [Acidothermus sp.]MCL6538318.1 chorismate mutase [Acidothermus sp.]